MLLRKRGVWLAEGGGKLFQPRMVGALDRNQMMVADCVKLADVRLRAKMLVDAAETTTVARFL